MNSSILKKVLTEYRLRLSVLGIFLSLTFLGSGMISCSKDDDTAGDSGNYYFRAAIDGRKVNFHNAKFQGGGDDNRWEHIVIGGYENSYPTDGSLPSPSLDFEIWRIGGNISAGTYTTPAEEGMIARYAIQTKEETLVYSTSYGDDVFSVNIETISKEGIRGTLSGKLRSINGDVVNVTEGSFNLPYDTMINP
ncbi:MULTISPECIES: hypothetical protein [Chryseobacterium]|uniref:Uncharacterized protein n=1 Tax=Chryseobacterium camelliae TaxID=1265445 RepID=A0ABU0TI76_9FLAO|nr:MULTISPECIES: hypothetical protein [Chryseobacterium]MDT3409377.1 hypothetical protein [Pseudacidovorax intermedius]MDQ1096758.1 hypothetical protein [Chryseobacterium camelliae]MDQ1100701.1 hypothetical protein [Chryseobacterium sp. SORGH_AS_1048]MDR6088040.1 hypothetical protein [Chryseobacterium sp. SORGH_AS_0909]MDR6132414.1 hypothetical protein [Chryseobacterium sp. SORGH_AS_1175]